MPPHPTFKGKRRSAWRSSVNEWRWTEFESQDSENDLWLMSTGERHLLIQIPKVQVPSTHSVLLCPLLPCQPEETASEGTSAPGICLWGSFWLAGQIGRISIVASKDSLWKCVCIVPIQNLHLFSLQLQWNPNRQKETPEHHDVTRFSKTYRF